MVPAQTRSRLNGIFPNLQSSTGCMNYTIKCPKCQHQFPMEQAMAEEYKAELRQQMQDFKRQKEEELQRKEKSFQEELQKREIDFARQAQAEKARLQEQLETQLRKSIAGDYETQVSLLKKQTDEQEERLRLAREKEFHFLQREEAMKRREAEMDLDVQRKLAEERQKLAEEIRKTEEIRLAARDNEYQMKIREYEKQLEDQKKLVDEMRRKADQGSQQLAGEVQELALEALLKQHFPFDQVEEVGKGVRGADCILTVRNQFGSPCGRIIFESKRTKDFQPAWISKLKDDMRSQGAEIAVLVTNVLPKDLSRFGEKEGIWICGFDEVKPLVHVLRDSLLRVAALTRSQENKGEKMQMLYSYLTSNEFGEQWKAIREGFMAMKQSIEKERDTMERLWKAREKQLERVLLNATHIKGSIEGIAGQDTIQMNLIDQPEADDGDNS